MRWLCILTLLAGCAPPASEGGFNSPDPASKLYAITRAGQTRDVSAVPDLIQQLESDDEAVRMYAIGALRRITGQDHGFVYYAPPQARRAAIQRWLAAYGDGPQSGPGDQPAPDGRAGYSQSR